MKVCLIQVDGKMPNLALMKIGSYHLSNDDIVDRKLDPSADMAYISVIWPENRPKALGIAKFFPDGEVMIGGSGYNYSTKLPNEIEHLMPAYDLWDINYSMGFTSRGCIRACKFCIVPKKEGNIKKHSSLKEFLHPKHDRVILLDNNLLASPNCNETLKEIHDWDLKVNYNQGLDIRLINDELANLLANTKYYNWTFKTRQIHFAFDDLNYEKSVRNGIEILNNNGIPSKDLMFYLLVGFNTSFNEDMKRYRILWDEFGAYPFIMVYNRTTNNNKKLKAFARWVNKRIHKVCNWDEYLRNPELGVGK